MKDSRQAAKDSGIARSLIDAVVEMCDIDQFEDVCAHGASAGFGQFIYYSYTCQFARDNRKEIVELVKRYADDFDIEPIEVVKGFNCLKGADGEDLDNIGRYIYGGRIDKDETTVLNCMAWFALEEVARAFCD